MSPNPKPTMPAVVAATGSTIFGNWICLISRSWETTEVVASLMLDGEPLPGQDRRQDEQRVVGRAGLEDDRHEDDVDDHLEERVEHPPDVPEEGVGALLPEIGLDEIADEPSARQDLVDPLANQRKGTRPGRRVTEGGRRLTGCGHRAEG